jgi:hypothetical protein
MMKLFFVYLFLFPLSVFCQIGNSYSFEYKVQTTDIHNAVPYHVNDNYNFPIKRNNMLGISFAINFENRKHSVINYSIGLKYDKLGCKLSGITLNTENYYITDWQNLLIINSASLSPAVNFKLNTHLILEIGMFGGYNFSVKSINLVRFIFLDSDLKPGLKTDLIKTVSRNDYNFFNVLNLGGSIGIGYKIGDFTIKYQYSQGLVPLTSNRRGAYCVFHSLGFKYNFTFRNIKMLF